MKKVLFTLGFMFSVSTSFAQSSTYVSGYTKTDGTVVQGYYRTTPDVTATNNYTYYGNTNNYTGVQGTQKLYQDTTPKEDRTIYTGSKGGNYYYNSNGNKTYIKTK